MSVSDFTRQYVRDRANGACELFHRDEYRGEGGVPMDVVHWQHQGFGGRPEDSETNNPKNLLWGCRKCHDLLHHPTHPYTILAYTPEDIVENGALIEPRTLQIAFPGKGKGRKLVPEDDLHFYVRELRPALGQILHQVRGDRMFEGDRAAAMLQLAEHFQIVAPTAKSPEQMFSSEGFDPEFAMRQVLAAGWISEHGLTWPRGLPVSKVVKFAKAPQKRLWRTLARRDVQDLLDASVDLSASDIDKRLQDLGMRQPQPRFRVILRPDGSYQLLRVRSLDYAVRLAGGSVVADLLAFRSGAQYHRKEGELLRSNGERMLFHTDDDEEAA